MKPLIILTVLLVGCNIAIGQNSILQYENIPNGGDGSYSFKFRSEDGTFRAESATVKLSKDNVPYLSVRGMYGYVDPEGVMHYYEYTADENGYQVGPLQQVIAYAAPQARVSMDIIREKLKQSLLGG